MLHHDLPIYKKGVDLLSLALDVQQQLPRQFKRSLGEKIHTQCVDMLESMAMANATRQAERRAHLEDLLKRLRVTTVLLRVAFDKHIVSPKLWAAAGRLLDGVQHDGWPA